MRLCTLATVAWLAISLAVAQAPTLQTTSRLVQVNVIVHDSKGKPVRDLTQNDFVVLDDGKPSRVAFFQVAEDRANAPTAVTPSHSSILDNRRSAQAQRAATATIILIDSLNMGGTDDLLYVKRELPKFLKNLQPGDPVALYNLAGPNVRIIHEFSENTESLIRSSQRGSGEVSQWLGSGAGDRAAKGEEAHIKAEWTLAAMETIAQHVADIPGRKTLVWVSGAFPINIGFDHTENLAGGVSSPKNGDLESYYDRLKRLARMLNKIDLAVYPVDPKALAIDSDYDAIANPAAHSRVVPVSRLRTEGENRAGEFATMDLIALETGGRAFYNANALGQSIQWAVDDSRVTYVLGFYPEESAWDGKYHKLEVHVNRPGVEVRSRRSYFAGDGAIESAPEREAALHTVAASPLDATAIGLTVHVVSNPLKPGAQEIQISVDPRDVRFESKGGKWRADFDLIVTQQAADGRRLAGERSQCIVDRESLAETQTKELSFQRDIDIGPRAASLRVLVRDSISGAVGSLAVPVGR